VIVKCCINLCQLSVSPTVGWFWTVGRQAGSNLIIRLRIERHMPRLPNGEVVHWQLEKNGCLRSCVAY